MRMTGEYKSPPLGQEISCVMKGVPEEFFLDENKLKKALEESLRREKFTVLKTTYHSFFPKGFTALILLAESHLAIHTYPEYNSVYLNIYSCRGPKDAEPVFNFLKQKLKPEKVSFFKQDEILVKH